ncbi:SDR family oxidoreductase [Flavilitoribacter nigricans]|uniref:Short-chain dehydrogenase n=1 Tax=Flavilitoribacter nigricans (strain ATCC 23147 / DSM 23189 / NBRC 102662 / NCIMB 1420 / SS-2) TaxID=1122177 RepID=A0A2D0N6R1_FLAN2|nr:SDR family oxidoreductase [Flavilitoribacter nigricans]PHN04070.1 short-chain dehydrogenase [Flavilitoribacter nigricans DSM 23189 = NBRC 102662]
MKILITGASRGIGLETALRLARSREHRILVLGRSEDALRSLYQAVALEEGEGILDYLVYDLNDSSPDLLNRALGDLDGLDILINNAGLLINKPFEQLSPLDWQESFETNFFSVVKIINICLPHFSRMNGGHIVNIGSMGGFQGSAKFNGLAAYSAAKAALANLTECLAEEFKDRRLSVNCLSLGAVQTEMLEAAFPGYQAPLSSDDMGEFVAWFATQGHRFFNGKILPVSVSTP